MELYVKRNSDGRITAVKYALDIVTENVIYDCWHAWHNDIVPVFARHLKSTIEEEAVGGGGNFDYALIEDESELVARGFEKIPCVSPNQCNEFGIIEGCGMRGVAQEYKVFRMSIVRKARQNEYCCNIFENEFDTNDIKQRDELYSYDLATFLSCVNLDSDSAFEKYPNCTVAFIPHEKTAARCIYDHMDFWNEISEADINAIVNDARVFQMTDEDLAFILTQRLPIKCLFVEFIDPVEEDTV
jgi:hypothetical protein